MKEKGLVDPLFFQLRDGKYFCLLIYFPFTASHTVKRIPDDRFLIKLFTSGLPLPPLPRNLHSGKVEGQEREEGGAFTFMSIFRTFFF